MAKASHYLMILKYNFCFTKMNNHLKIIYKKRRTQDAPFLLLTTNKKHDLLKALSL